MIEWGDVNEFSFQNFSLRRPHATRLLKIFTQFFSVSNNVSYLVQDTLGAFLGSSYFNNYFQAKETA